VTPLSQRADSKDSGWLEWRRHGIGGSDAAAIAGLSPWRSPFVVWLEKTGQLPANAADESEAMRWGTLLEPVIADEFELRRDRLVVRRQSLWEDPCEPWRRVTLDGLVIRSADPTRALGVYEGKTTSALRHALDWSAGIPLHYAIQVQHTLSVLALDRAWVTCLVGGQRLEIHEIDRDPEAISILLSMEREFWQRVEGNLPPPPVDGGSRTAAAIREAFRESSPGEIVELGDDWRAPLRELEEWRRLRASAETHIAEIENRITAAMAEAEIAELDGREVVTWKAHQRHSLDVAALREAEPEIADRFTRTQTVRRLLVKASEAGGQ
jgi:putative phage-type endonuclease